MSGGEPSSIKQNPACATGLPILNGLGKKAVRMFVSIFWCAVLQDTA